MRNGRGQGGSLDELLYIEMPEINPEIFLMFINGI